jgi:hypothetical protein
VAATGYATHYTTGVTTGVFRAGRPWPVEIDLAALALRRERMRRPAAG